MASIPDGQSKTDGMAVGQSVANAIIAMRQNDGSTDYVAYTPGTAPGDWQPTAPSFMPAENPQWATLKPFAMTSDSQFRPGGRPRPRQPGVRRRRQRRRSDLGAVNSTTRTADETQIAKFWNDKAGTYTPPGHWNAIAEQVAQQQGYSLAQDARLFAELNIAEGDAAIVAWDAKYTYNTWRPITARRRSRTPRRTARSRPIANWDAADQHAPVPRVRLGPQHLQRRRGGDPHGGLRRQLQLHAPPRSACRASPAPTPASSRRPTRPAMSRIYGGIHFLFSNPAGLTAGAELGAYVLQTFSTSSDNTPPTITITSPPTGSVTTASISRSPGTVLDNLSGVASFEVQVDGGSFAPVSFDSPAATSR